MGIVVEEEEEEEERKSIVDNKRIEEWVIQIEFALLSYESECRRGSFYAPLAGAAPAPMALFTTSRSLGVSVETMMLFGIPTPVPSAMPIPLPVCGLSFMYFATSGIEDMVAYHARRADTTTSKQANKRN